MKNFYKPLLISFFILLSSDLFSQYATSVTMFPFITGQNTDVAPQCTGGIIYDDNTFENGYGWSSAVTDGRILQKIRPPSYPFTINQLCFAFTRLSTATPDWTFDIMVYDTLGSDSLPGNLVAAIPNQTAINIPTFPAFGWFDFSGITAIPELTAGSYYIGIKSNHSLFPSHYIGGDQSASTPSWPSYYSTNGGAWWTRVDSLFPNRKALGIRADGVGPAPLTHDFAMGPFLSLPFVFFPGNTYNIKARIRNLGTVDESGVLVKFFVDEVLYDFVNVSLDSGAVDSVSFLLPAGGGGARYLKIVSALFNDQNRINDTILTKVSVLAPGGTFDTCRHVFKPIPDLLSIRDTINVTVPAWAFGIMDVNVKIDTVTHTWDSDLFFTLSHNTTTVNIISHAGSSGDNFIGTILDDSASTPIGNGTAPFTGSFRPWSPLSVFNGTGNDPNGPWVLSIYDSAAGDTGTFRAWCLTVSYLTYVGGVKTVTISNYYSLKQNYPNPFNPSTKIEYAVPRQGVVKLVVYDILGKEIAVLVDEYKNPGIYNVEFNGANISSGVYFYRIESGSFTMTKKMLLIK